MILDAGTKLGPYEVLDLLGQGGMGEVYRARDPRLRRDVAIKVLATGFDNRGELRERLEREARTVSSLNHPNICMVYDIGELEDRPFIVMECLEGRSLREIPKPLGTADLLDAAIQVCEGLSAAHGRDIVHRDIKPANLFMMSEGRVKVLDFGIAKLATTSPIDSEPPGARETAATLTASDLTRPGTTLGTIAYMSPEQLRGQDVDARSDIFSLGIVLYELATGRHPFAAETPAATIDAILNSRPTPLRDVDSDRPAGLEHVIDKSLEKGRELRYQHATEIAADLRRLQRDTDPGNSVVMAANGARPARRTTLLAGIGLALAIAVLVGVVLLRSRPKAFPSSSEWVQITDFTDAAMSPALSPDGSMLAFLRGEGDFTSFGQIYVQILPEGAPARLTNDDRLKMSPKFSPDGSRIAYTVPWDTWEVPVLGGKPRLLLNNASGLTWTDDGQLLYSEIRAGIHMALVTSTESRTSVRDVYVPTSERGMAHRSYRSPDGQWVLVAEMNYATWLPCRLLSFGADGQGVQVGPANAECWSAAWTPDGRWMYLTIHSGNSFHIWRQRFPDGEPEQVTGGPTEERGIAMAPDGRSFITSVGNRQSSIWMVDSDTDYQVSSQGFAFSPRLSSDGSTLYYLVRRDDGAALSRVDLGSGEAQNLFPDFAVRSYDLARDSTRLLLVSENRGG